MKNLKKSFLFFILFFYVVLCSCQNKIDSLVYYSKLTMYPKQDTDLLKSYLFFEKTLKESIVSKNANKHVYSLLYKASIEFKQGFYTESEKNLTKALSIVDHQKESEYLNMLRTSVYNQLGILYKKQENYDQAIKLYNTALIKATEKKDSVRLYNNIANIYKEKAHYVKAKSILENTLIDFKFNNSDTITKALVLDNLGVIKSKINSNEGLNEILEALELRKLKNNTIGLYTSYDHLTKYFLQKNNLAEAKKYALKSLEIARKLKSISYLQNSLSLLVDLNNDNYVKVFKKINDSIYKANQSSANKFALLKYNTTKQEKLAQENLLKAEKEKKHKLIYQSIGAFILLISIAGYFFYREKNKKKIVENVIQTEGRISKTVHDVIANDLYQVMTKLQISNNITEEVLDDLESVYSKARNISRDNYVIEENMDYFEILNDLFLSYQSNEVTVITQNLKNVTWENISIHKRNMLYRVLKELMTNMTKYSQATLVTVLFKENSKNLEISYKDNGVGCVLTKKNGLLNAETRIKSVNGTITFESEPQKGFKTKIII